MEGHPFRDAPKTLHALPSTRVAAGSKRLRDFLLIGGFALIWDLLVGVAVVAALEDLSVPVILFTLLFVVSGLGITALGLYHFLVLFNPRVELQISEGLPALGDTLHVHWKIVGSTSRIRGLKIELVGVESATYQRGTDTTTDTHVFERHRIAHTDDRQLMREGTGSTVIPAGAVPSFRAKHNQIRWEIRFEGDIPRWPDLEETFELDVVAGKPHRAQRGAA